MKQLARLLLLVPVVLSCKPSGGDQKDHNEPGSSKNRGPDLEVIVSEFPSSKLDELVEEVSQEELEAAVTKGESDHWKRTTLDVNTGEISIQNKDAKDNIVKFKLYGRTPSYAMIAVQQANAQVATTEIWEYRFTVNEDHPEQWEQYLLPEYKLADFFDDRVVLPQEFQGESARPYLNYEFTPTSLVMSINKWAYMSKLESDSVQSYGPLDPTLIKYKYVFKWNGTDFDEQKANEAGYVDVHTFISHTVETSEDGPGPHEFDCGHGVSVKASSTLANQGNNNYSAKNLTDGKDATAWSEGVAGHGMGEWIEFTITSNFFIGSSWQIGNGYNRSNDVWQQNSRVRKMKVLVDDQLIGHVMLSNIPAYQTFDIAPSWLKDSPSFKKGTTIRFVIEEVYQGSKFDDTLISYFVPVGNCG